MGLQQPAPLFGLGDGARFTISHDFFSSTAFCSLCQPTKDCILNDLRTPEIETEDGKKKRIVSARLPRLLVYLGMI